METRRRRRPKRDSDGSSTAVHAVILLIIFGAAAYLLFGTGVGNAIKERYSLSLFDKIRERIAGTPQPSAVPFVSVPPTAEPSPAPTGETSELSLPGLDAYMLQMGVFADLESASRAALSMKALGGAGYVYEENGVFRLIASAYSDESSAANVRERLAEEGYDCSVFRLEHEGVDLVVTAAPERLIPVRTAFALAGELTEELDELALSFDADSKSTELGLDMLFGMRTNIENALSGIREPAKQNEILAYLSDYLSDVSELIGDAVSFSSERAAFTSALKVLRIKTTLLYRGLLDKLGG